MRASEIPAATTANPPEPVRAICRKDLMMPTTVPRSPMKGDMLPMVPRIQRRSLRRRISCVREMLRVWAIRSGVRSRSRSVSLNMRLAGRRTLSQEARAVGRSFTSREPTTRVVRSWVPRTAPR
jgi:hypothetical protein